MEIRINHQDVDAAEQIAHAVRRIANQVKPHFDHVVLVCIGTDRSSGDSLGPFVGMLLHERGSWPFEVMGTLDDPIHGGNLEEVAARLQYRRDTLVIAVDSALGLSKNIGAFFVNDNPVKPGAGVNKVLPPIGDMHVYGVVNVAGFMEYFVLQNTRLNLIYRMALVMADGIGAGLSALAPRAQVAATQAD